MMFKIFKFILPLLIVILMWVLPVNILIRTAMTLAVGLDYYIIFSSKKGDSSEKEEDQNL